MTEGGDVMWASKWGQWVPVFRAGTLVAVLVVALGGRGWAVAAIFGGWAMLDGTAVMGSAARRYDEESPWVMSLLEGLSQLLLAIFAWVWWGTGATDVGRAIGILVMTAAVALLVAASIRVWFEGSDRRIPQGAVASCFLVAVAFASDPSSPRELVVALVAYAAVFTIAAAIRSFRLGSLGGRLVVPAASGASIVLIIVVAAGALAALGR